MYIGGVESLLCWLQVLLVRRILLAPSSLHSGRCSVLGNIDYERGVFSEEPKLHSQFRLETLTFIYDVVFASFWDIKTNAELTRVPFFLRASSQAY